MDGKHTFHRCEEQNYGLTGVVRKEVASKKKTIRFRFSLVRYSRRGERNRSLCEFTADHLPDSRRGNDGGHVVVSHGELAAGQELAGPAME